MSTNTVASPVAILPRSLITNSRLRESAARPLHLGYRPELDGIRAIAVLLVIFHHARPSLLNGGFLGVDIFFVLSGFLITTLLYQEHSRTDRVSLKDFYLRRALRLLPALYLLLVAFLGYALLTKDSQAKSIKAAAYTFFYVADYARAFGYSTLGEIGHTWSLAIEEQFYMAWPLLLVLLFKVRASKFLTFFLLLALIGLTVLNRVHLWGHGDFTRIYFAFDTRADSLLIGCALGVLGAWGKIPTSQYAGSLLRFISIPLSIGLIAAVLLLPAQSTYFYSLTLISAGLGVMLMTVLASPNTRLTAVLSFGPLAWCGRVSYGLYLWHYPVARVVESFGLPNIPAFLLGVGLTFIITACSFYLLEKPFLRLKRRFAVA